MKYLDSRITTQNIINETGVEYATAEGIANYINYHRSVGGFLTAVFCNDLKESCARADSNNQGRLFLIVQFLYMYAPSPCWGSVDRHREWLENKEED